jgi:hypothetical protein
VSAAQEPVALAEIVRMAAAGLATVGWVTIPEAWVNVVISVLAAVVSIVGTVRARGKVTPLPPATVNPIIAEDVPRGP